MTPEEMKAALTTMLDDFWHKEDVDAAYAIYADDVVFQRIPFPPVEGKAANMQADAGMLAAFSSNRLTIDEIIVEGEAAAIRWTWEGTHSGVSPSLGIPPTGKRVSMWDAVSSTSKMARSWSNGNTATCWACYSSSG